MTEKSKSNSTPRRHGGHGGLVLQKPRSLSPCPPRLRGAHLQFADYVELHSQSAFSFLRATAAPEDLAAAAARTGHSVFGIADIGGLYGAPRFHAAALREGVRPLVGAELDVAGGGRGAPLREDPRRYKNPRRPISPGHLPAGQKEGRVSPP